MSTDRIRLLLACACLGVALAATGPAARADDPDYKNPNLPFDRRVADLVGRMTVEEKAAQAEMYVPENSRLGIPAMDWWSEAIHGVARAGRATVFPEAIGMAASWDPPLMGKVGEATADEARAKYVPGRQYYGLTLWAPTINMARDPRWGRCEETYGEDPVLTGKLAVAFIKGLQGDDPKYLKTVATPKHFAMHSQETGRTSSSFNVSERTLREYYLPAFHDSFVEGGAMSVMAAHNGINGVPDHMNKLLLTDILRNEWGFKGAVVSDFRGVSYLYTDHRAVANYQEAIAAAMNAGLDVDCAMNGGGGRGPGGPGGPGGGGNSLEQLLNAVNSGAIKIDVLNQSVSRNLLVRFKLGMFDPPDIVPFAKTPPSVIGSKEHLDIALQMARESMVLLKNDPAPKGYGMEKLLPLDLRRVHSVAVLGYYANEQYFGNYSTNQTAGPAPTLVEAMRAKLGDRVTLNALPSNGPGILNGPEGRPSRGPAPPDLQASLKLAEQSDVVVVSLGLSAQDEFEGVDRSSLELPVDQLLFLDRIVKVNPLTIVVLNGGSPIGCATLKDKAPAIMMAWYPGEQGSNAIVETLLGENNPSGRLPITFYRSTADLPPLNDYEISKGRTYMYAAKPPTYVFGHGLSYTTFEYSNLKTPAKCSPTDPITVTLNVANTGDRDGDEVVQLYVHEKDSKLNPPPPLKVLKAFQRISIPKGQSKTVSLSLQASDLAYWNTAAHKFEVEPGTYEIMVGASSDDVRVRGMVEIR